MQDEIKVGSPLYDTGYIVDKNLGGGGDGKVYAVHHKDFPNVKYAAKIFLKPEKVDDEYWKKRGNEILTSFRISKKPNPNLMSTYDVFVRPNNDIILIMDYIDGITLKEYLVERGCLSPKIALNVFKKLLNGIKQLHSYKQKIIHRDLKPENIMISQDLSKVVIIDFSISTVVSQDINKILTNEAEMFGTPSYILPDLLDKKNKQEANNNVWVQSDFFSLGVILYEMVMGTFPFNPIYKSNGKIDQSATIKLPLRFDMINISANPTIPVSLENIIYRCIVCKPRELSYRYTNIDQIIDDVNKCLIVVDKKTDPAVLLKPINQRFYQFEKLIEIDDIRAKQKWYKKWWFFTLITIIGIIVIIVAIISFFVI